MPSENENEQGDVPALPGGTLAGLFSSAAAEIQAVIVDSEEDPVPEDLGEVFKPFIEVESFIAGNESALGDIFASVKSNLQQGTQYVMAKAGETARVGFRNTATAVIKQLGTRKQFIARTVNQVKMANVPESITFTNEQIKRLTSTGDLSNLEKDLDHLISEMELVLRFAQELEGYYSVELNLFKDISKIANTNDAVALIQKLDKLKLPEAKFAVTQDSMSNSYPLPGGKVSVIKDTGRIDLSSQEINIDENTVSFAKEDLLRILTQLTKVVDLYKRLARALENYGDYISKFNTVVGTAFLDLEKMKGEISFNLIQDMQSRLQGNVLVYSFFSSFLPKITIYLDDYVEGLTSSLSKPFN